MGFLSNRTINRLNLANGLFGLLEQSFWIFIPLYLYQLGFSISEVFLLTAMFNAARIPLRFFSFPIVHRIGLKYALMLGIGGYCLSYPILAMVKGYDLWLALYTCVFGLFNALYWHCFHTFYTLAGEAEHRGKHMAVSQGLTLVVSALAPLLSALVVVRFGYEPFFLFSLPWLVVTLFILSGCTTIPVSRKPWAEGKTLIFNLGAKIHIAEAAAVFPLNIGWLFVLYLYVEKLVSLGGIVTFGIVAQILYQLWLGSMMDRGGGRFIANMAGGLRSILVIMRAFLPLSVPRILGAETLGGGANTHHMIAQPTVMYNAAKHSDDAFWYWLFAETAFDLGTIIGCVAAASLLWLGVKLQLVILLALPGVLTVWWLTYRYYGKHYADI